MRFVFLHGGPGLNSFAEQVILGPSISAAGHETTFWNEPSINRPDGDPFNIHGAFEHWIASAERAFLAAAATEPVCVLAHSFSYSAACELARRYPERIAGLVLIAPAAKPSLSFKNVLKVAQGLASQETVTMFDDCVSRTCALLDAPMRRGFELILGQPALLNGLFTSYWVNRERFRAWLSTQTSTKAQFDVASFLSVLDDYCARADTLRSARSVSTRTLVFFARQDPVVMMTEQAPAVQADIPHAQIELIDDCGHFIHLERPQDWVRRVLEWSSATT